MRTDDGCIIRECLGGESEAFGVLVDKYKGGIYAFAYAKLGNFQDAQDSLSEAYREVLMLHYFGGMNSKEIARVLGTSPTAVRMRLSRARAQLREEMVTMMDTAFEGHRLQASFTFRIVEGVRRIKINPMPRMTALPWGLSLAAGITIVVLSLSPHLDILNPVSPPAGSAPPSSARVLKNGEIPVDVMKISQMPFISAMQGDGNSEASRQQSALLMAPAAEGDTWAAKGDMPTPRYMLAAVALNGKIYAIGGLAGFDGIDKGDCFSVVEEYDPATDTWTKRADMPELRYLLSSAVVSNRIYVMGGSSTVWPNTNFLPSVAEYTPPGWPFSVSPLSPQGKLPTKWAEAKLY